MKQTLSIALCLLAAFSTTAGAEEKDAFRPLDEWSALPPLPDEFGFAGPFAGVSGDALVVAGGANFPDGPPWEDKEANKKVWHDRIFVLPKPDGQWIQCKQRLTPKVAYGVSISTDHGIVCIGGCDAAACSKKVFVLKWDAKNERLIQTDKLVGAADDENKVLPLPDLPVPLASMSGAAVGDVIYVAGGHQTMGADVVGTTNFYRLDLSKKTDEEEFQWEELPWPEGASRRVLSISAAQSDGREKCFYMISGRDRPGIGAKFLTDGWKFSPGDYKAYVKGGSQAGENIGWHAIGNTLVDGTPLPCMMAGCGIDVGVHHVLVIGGDDGEHFGKAEQLKDRHPGFPDDMFYAYHTVTDTWVRAGTLSKNHVTTVAVKWKNEKGKAAIVIPSGETRPAVRSPAVLVAPLTPTKAGFRTLDYIVLVVYLSALVAMGVYFSRREKSTDDFFLGGKRVPWWAAGLSIFGTQLSAITFMAIPALVYRTNWVYFLGNMMIVAIAPLVVWVYLPFYRRLNVTSAYEYLERRFNVAVRLLGSGAFVLFQLGRMGVVLALPAMALSAVTGVDIYLCIVVMGVLATLYTVLGGIEAVIWTDVLQVFVLLGGALLSLLLIAGGMEGGFMESAGDIVAMGAAEDKFHAFNLTWDIATTALWIVIVGRLLEQLVPYTSDQTVVQRYLTTADEKAAARSIWTNALLTIPASLLFFAVGTALWAFYKTHPDSLAVLEKPGQIFPWFIVQELPVGISGLVIAGLFAAAMSSLDSSMNSMATAITTDFYRRFRADVSDHHCLNLARWLTILLGVLGTGSAIIIAYLNDPSMWDQYTKILGLFGGGLAGLFAAGIFTRRTNGAGIVVGFVVSGVILYFVGRAEAVHFFLYAAIGIVTCFVVGYLASWVLPGKPHTDGLTVYTVKR